MSAVLHAALARSKWDQPLRVVDLGGALGTHYFQLRPFLSGVPLRWRVLEQQAFVELGNAEFADGSLEFIDAANLGAERPDLVICSSVLQYIDGVEKVLGKLIRLKPRAVFIDRTSVTRDGGDFWTVQSVPKSIYAAKYPCRIFSQPSLLRIMGNSYRLRADGECEREIFERFLLKYFWLVNNTSS